MERVNLKCDISDVLLIQWENSEFIVLVAEHLNLVNLLRFLLQYDVVVLVVLG